MSHDVSHVDGRVLRGQRNRQAIVDALLDLYKDGVVDPTARQIAARAGVSTRSVFAHFEDRERLVEAVAASQEPIVRRLVDPAPPETDLDGRIEWLACARAEYFDAAQSVIRAALRYRDEQPAIAKRVHRDGLVLRGQVENVFRPELDRLSGGDREACLDAADAIFSFELWRRLRSIQGLDAGRTHRVICHMARQLLA